MKAEGADIAPRMAGVPGGRTNGPPGPVGGSVERLLDRREHRLAVRVAALVVAHLAQLGRIELAEPRLHLSRGEVVVAEDRERGPDPSRPARAVDLADHAIGGCGDGAAERAAEHALELGQEVVGLPAAARQQLRRQVGRVLAGEAPALDRLVERSLHPVAGEHDELERVQDPLELVAQALTGRCVAARRGGRLARASGRFRRRRLARGARLRTARRRIRLAWRHKDLPDSGRRGHYSERVVRASPCTVRRTIRVLTWNLFHGRAHPPAGAPLAAQFAAALAGWEWDVAMLQEVPPWWPEPLARATGAQARWALTSRNWFRPVSSAIARRDPDLMKAWGGGCNALLVRGEVRDHRVAELTKLPERRVTHGVRLADGSWVVNLHATTEPKARTRADCALALGAAREWAAGAPLVFGGDFNLDHPAWPGIEPVAGHEVDHLHVSGFEPAGAEELLDNGVLSDHRPLRLELRSK